MRYIYTIMILTLPLWARGQPKPLADRVSELERLVERLDKRVMTLEAVNRILAEERKSLLDSLFVIRETAWRNSMKPRPEAPAPEVTRAAPSQPAPRVELPVASTPVPTQALMSVTPAPETKPAQPLAASKAPAARSSSVKPKPAAPRARPS